MCNGGIAHQESAIEKRGIRLHVRFIEFLEVVRMPDLMPDLELQIPQRVEDAFNRLFVNSVLEEKQKVDIRLRMNSAAAVSADGEQAIRAGRLPISPKFLKDVVDFVAYDAFDRNGCRILQELDLQLVQEPLQICPGRHGAHGPMLARRRMPLPLGEGTNSRSD